jgi:hypothetical protein
MFDQEPEGYAELCSQMRKEKDPARVQLLWTRIDALLKEHSRRHSEGITQSLAQEEPYRCVTRETFSKVA